jgi:predicted RNase H-like HicB family nuclease
MRYLVVIEKAKKNYSAYVPDLPGCIATGSTKKAVEKNIAEAINFHLEGLKEDRIRLPLPAADYTYIEASA